ncbi:MAG TPA: PAS domain-containing sensor histidine kinase, partial [Gemmatimonadaceae bacterium]
HPSQRATGRQGRETQPFETDAASVEQAVGGIAHETGELHRLLVAGVQDYAIFALDPQGFILSWNAGGERFMGYTADEIIGKHFSIFYPPEKVAERFPDFELREAERTGRFEDEGWRVRKDGSRFWANVVITALRDRAGRLLGYAKVTRDLTQRRAAEEALRLSEERFRLLVQSVKDYAIFMLDPTGHVATWNDGAQRIKGYTEVEIVGKHFSIFYPPEKQAEHFPEHELNGAVREGRFEDEGWRVRKDGSRFWANVVITALRNHEGHLVGFGKVTRDLTERRAGEQRAIEDAQRVAAEEAARRTADEARARSEKLQALTSALAATHDISEIAQVIFTDGFAAMGVDAGSLGVVDASGQFMELLADHGYEALPSRFRRVALSEDLPMTEAIRTERVVAYHSRGDRNVRFHAVAELLSDYEESVAIPLATHGRPMGALALHRRSPEPSTPDMLAFMESFAQQCAQALERAQLYEAERQARHEADEARVRAEEANRAKMEFLAAMSHELRTPLNAIGGYAQLLELGIHGSVSDEQREPLMRIRRSQQHLLGIINDILNFSRIDAGQITYDLSTVPVREVLESVGQMIAPLADAKGLTFTITGCPADAVAWADRAKMEQVLLNLLSNAVKFTPHGGRVMLSCERTDAAAVAVTVRDTGTGIPAAQLERIFEPFVQVGRSLTETREGAGLGLAISRDLARAMDGELGVVSSAGEGSAFTLVLPAARPE